MLQALPRGLALATLALLLAAATGPALAAPASGDDPPGVAALAAPASGDDPPGVAALAAEAEATGLSAADARALAGAVAESGALAATTEDEILRASNAGEDDRFGFSVALSGDRAIVGANNESGPADGTQEAGAAYVFERDASGAWAEVQILRASNAGVDDGFGISVAISGDRVLVGAGGEDGPTDGTSSAGAVYVFERDASGAWAEVQILRASNAGEFDRFGRSVALSGDRAIVGAFGERGPTDGTFRAGAAYVFERDASGAWAEVQILRASNPGQNYLFGFPVAISGDRAIVGARGEAGPTDGTPSSGAAYVFERDASGAWAEAQVLRASNAGASDFFGDPVAISGDRAIVGASGEDGPTDDTSGAGAAYVFERDASGAWAEVQILRASNAGEGDAFGRSVALSGDRALVGAGGEEGPTDDTSSAGAAYVFERDASGAWAEVQVLRASNAGASDRFGDSVALSGDRVLVGARFEDGPTDDTSSAGAAYVFSLGAPPVDVDIASVTTPVAPGDAFTLAGTVENNTAGRVVARLRVSATAPNGRVYTRRGTVKVDPGATEAFSIGPRTLPANTPPGTYAITIEVLVDGEVIDTATTEVVVESAATKGAAPEALAAAPEALAAAPEAGPNPFRTSTTIRYELAEASAVELRVYDVAGREVAVLASGVQPSGAHGAVLEAGSLPSGVYVWRLAVNGAVTTGRVTLAR